MDLLKADSKTELRVLTAWHALAIANKARDRDVGGQFDLMSCDVPVTS